MPRLVLLAIPILAAAGVGATLLVRDDVPPPVFEAAPSPTAAPTPAPLVIDVAGAVARPGVFRLPPGARVVDAVAAAGGFTADADRTSINQAAPLRDGARVYVPRPGEPPPAGSSGSEAERKVNLNLAGAAELEGLPGIGPSTAARIVHSREGKPFARADDLQTRGLVSPRVFADLRDSVTVR
ncbi:MAG TPA: SLBB domain-containing protein [Candidatus Saccharimonadales bacterium]|nr:SLBB domain-containing protein [Candidatus Saccharimonadales bacterium]